MAIESYLLAQASAGAPRTTIGCRKQHLEHLARRIDTGPWETTGEQLVEYVGAQVWATETRRGRRSTFRSFYAWAVLFGRVEASPALLLPRVKAAPPRPRPIPEHLYATAMSRSGDRTRLVLRLAHDAGLRRREIALVHSDDVFEDLHGWSLRVHGKGNKERDVPLTPRLAFELRALPYGWAFPGAIDGHLSPRRVGELAVDVLPSPWTIHTLRHSFATRAYGHESDLFVVQELLGHASPATTRVYVQVQSSKLRSTVNAVAS